jgi:hypothetical protein
MRLMVTMLVLSMPVAAAAREGDAATAAVGGGAVVAAAGAAYLAYKKRKAQTSIPFASEIDFMARRRARMIVDSEAQRWGWGEKRRELEVRNIVRRSKQRKVE